MTHDAEILREIDRMRRYQLYTMSLIAAGFGAVFVGIASAGADNILYPVGALTYLGGLLLWGLGHAEETDGYLRSAFVKLGMFHETTGGESA